MRARSRKKGSGWFQKILLALNIIAVAILLICYLASVISPATFWPIAFIGLAYPILLLVNLAFALVWLFKKPVYSLISFGAILIGWNFLVSTIGFREPNAIQVPKSSDDILRVMTWNVHFFKRFESEYEKSVKSQMMDVIRKEQPDVLCIQEFFSRRKGDFNFKKAIIEVLESEHYYIDELAGNDYEMNGFAIFSKFPITNRGKLQFPDISPGNDVVFTDIKVNKQTVRVYNVHLQSISFQPEDYEYLKSVKEIRTDVTSTKRLSNRMKTAFIKRAEQAEIIKEEVSKLKIPYIIAGDFNDTPVSYAVNTITDGLKNSFRKKGSGFGITYNGDFPNFQIDYILVSPEFDVKNYIIIDKRLSDHYAVRSDLELKP